jgi:hypothetical protein
MYNLTNDLPVLLRRSWRDSAAPWSGDPDEMTQLGRPVTCNPRTTFSRFTRDYLKPFDRTLLVGDT